jgi:hypothetical protein
MEPLSIPGKVIFLQCKSEGFHEYSRSGTSNYSLKRQSIGMKIATPHSFSYCFAWVLIFYYAVIWRFLIITYALQCSRIG